VIELRQKNRAIDESVTQAYAYLHLTQDQDQNPVDFRFIKFNKAFEKLTGSTGSKLSSKSYKVLFKDNEIPFTFDHLLKIALGAPGEYFDWISRDLNRLLRIEIISSEPKTLIFLLTDLDEIHKNRVNEILANSINDVIFMLDDDLKVLNIYTQDERHLFMPKEEMLHQSLAILFPDEFKKRILPAFERARKNLQRESVIYPSTKKEDGRWYKAIIVYVKDEAFNGYVVSINEYTNHKLSSDALSDTSTRLQQLAEYTRTYIWECDQDGLYTYLSNNVKDLIGYEPEELIGKIRYYDLFHEAVREKLKKEINEILATSKTLVDYPNELVTKNNSTLSVSTNCFPIIDDEGHLIGYRGSNVDVTVRNSIEEALRVSERKFRLITENISDVIWVLSVKTMKTIYISPSVINQTGYTPEEAMNLKPEEIILSTSMESYRRTLTEGIQYFIQHPLEDKIRVVEVQEYCKDGTVIWIEDSLRFRFDEHGDVEIVGVSRNIDHRKQTEKEILYLSYHDKLTGVYNRSFYEEEILRLNTERNLPFTLVICDINGLKLTNDAFGHMAGDRLIISLARVFQKVCRRDDIIARIGGDEFALLLPNTSEKVAKMIMSRIHDEIALTKPETIKLSASFGYQTKTTVGEDFSEIFKQAEDKMYHEKIKHHSNIRTGTINLVTTSLFEKYPEEKQHAHNVSTLCRKIGEALGLSSREVADLEMAGFLHDIGKIGLEEGLIKVENYASFDETPEFKRHSEMGYQIIRSVYTYAHIADYILAHHEWFNGMGYPKGLKGNEIPLQARIIKLANDFSSQIDREGSDLVTAMKFIQARNAVQYDPALVLILQKMFENNPKHY